MSSLLADRPLPETETLSAAQYNLVFYSLAVAAFALFASFLYSWTTRNEVSTRYRPAVLASLIITAVAFLSYVVVIVKFDSGYDRVRGSFAALHDHGRVVPHDRDRLRRRPRRQRGRQHVRALDLGDRQHRLLRVPLRRPLAGDDLVAVVDEPAGRGLAAERHDPAAVGLRRVPARLRRPCLLRGPRGDDGPADRLERRGHHGQGRLRCTDPQGRQAAHRRGPPRRRGHQPGAGLDLERQEGRRGPAHDQVRRLAAAPRAPRPRHAGALAGGAGRRCEERHVQ